jgi:hypothetical protein
MPDPVSGITAGTAVLGAYSSNKAAKSAGKDASRANAAAMAFERQKYDDWNAVYGPIQDNLANYYSGLDGDIIATRGLEAYEREYQDAIVDLNESLAQRGIEDSGLAIELERVNTMDRAKNRAKIRTTAEDEAMAQKMDFLQVGMQTNPDASMSQTLGDNASRLNTDAGATAAASAKAGQLAIDTVGKAAGDYLTDKGSKPVSNPSTGYTRPNDGNGIILDRSAPK